MKKMVVVGRTKQKVVTVARAVPNSHEIMMAFP